MKSGSPAQKDLRFALDLLNRVENIISNAALNPSHKEVQELASGVLGARDALARMLGQIPDALRGGDFTIAGLDAERTPARSMDPMKIALRVLSNLTDRKQPDTRDLDALVRICGHEPAGVGWDEFACEALQKVLSDRAAARQFLALRGSTSR